jgi:O-antigen/teichoic acid export membrane protein
MARHLVSAVSGLLIVAVIARKLGVERLAAWTMIGTTSYLIGVSDLGMSSVVQRSASRDKDRAARALGSAFVVITVVAIPLLLASWFGIRALLLDRMPPQFHAETGRALAVALLGGFVGSYTYPVRAWLLATDGVRGVAGARMVGALAQIAVGCGGLYWVRSLVAPSLAVVATQAVEFFLLQRRLRARAPEARLWFCAPQDRAEARSFAHEALAAVTIQATVAAATRADVLIVAGAVPLETVAAYGVVARAVDQALVFAKQIGTALIAKLGDVAERERTVRIGTAALGVVSASGLAALGCLGQPLLIAWAGPVARHPAVPTLLALSAFAAVLVGLTEVLSIALLVGAPTPWSSALPVAAGCTVNVAATAALVGPLGAAGASLAAIGGHLVTGALVVRGAQRLLAWSPTDFVHAAAPAMAAGLAASAVGVALALGGQQGLLSAVSGAGVAIVAGSAAGYFTWRTLSPKPPYAAARMAAMSSDSSTST